MLLLMTMMQIPCMQMMMMIMMMLSAADDDDDANNDDDTAEYVIPETDKGLKERFNHLFIEFTRTKEHGHKLNVLLSEMLNRGLVTPMDY